MFVLFIFKFNFNMHKTVEECHILDNIMICMYNFLFFMNFSKSLILFKSLQRTHTAHKHKQVLELYSSFSRLYLIKICHFTLILMHSLSLLVHTSPPSVHIAHHGIKFVFESLIIFLQCVLY